MKESTLVNGIRGTDNIQAQRHRMMGTGPVLTPAMLTPTVLASTATSCSSMSWNSGSGRREPPVPESCWTRSERDIPLSQDIGGLGIGGVIRTDELESPGPGPEASRAKAREGSLRCAKCRDHGQDTRGQLSTSSHSLPFFLSQTLAL